MNETLDTQFDDATLWREEAKALRAVLLETGLTEARKWGQPCYTHGGANIAIIQRMKDFLALAFFKGALLKDPEGVLEWPGPNSRHGKRIRFTSRDDVARLAPVVRACVAEAIEAERSGLKVEASDAFDLPDELEAALGGDADLRKAFEALTPGRQRGWCLHFSQPKQSATRMARIEKARERILAGKGMHDR